MGMFSKIGVAAGLLALLSACGGGGGNPGVCYGGPQVCAEGVGASSVPSTDAATTSGAGTGGTSSVPSTDPTTSSGAGAGLQTAACADFQFQQDAQAVFLAGARQLDGDNDGVACESLPSR